MIAFFPPSPSLLSRLDAFATFEWDTGIPPLVEILKMYMILA